MRPASHSFLIQPLDAGTDVGEGATSFMTVHPEAEAVAIRRRFASRGIDAKDRVIRRNSFEGGYRCLGRHREVLAATRGDLAPGLQDGCSSIRWNFLEHDPARPTPLDERLAVPRANIFYPFRVVAEHRNNVATAFVAGADQDDRAETTAATTLYLQRDQGLRCQPKPGYPGPRAVPNPSKAGRAPIPVEVP